MIGIIQKISLKSFKRQKVNAVEIMAAINPKANAFRRPT